MARRSSFWSSRTQIQLGAARGSSGADGALQQRRPAYRRGTGPSGQFRDAAARNSPSAPPRDRCRSVLPPHLRYERRMPGAPRSRRSSPLKGTSPRCWRMRASARSPSPQALVPGATTQSAPFGRTHEAVWRRLSIALDLGRRRNRTCIERARARRRAISECVFAPLGHTHGGRFAMAAADDLAAKRERSELAFGLGHGLLSADHGMSGALSRM